MTEVSMTPIFHSKSTSGEQSEHLTELWKKIENHEFRNEKAKIKVDQLFAQYEKKLAPFDKRFGNTRCVWVKHLISFLDSKELKNATRSKLMQVIEYELSELLESQYYCDMNDVNALCDEYDAYHDKMFKKEKQQALNSACSHFKNMMKDMFGDDVELPHQDIQDAIKSGNPFEIDALINQIKDSYFDKNVNIFSGQEKESEEWDDFEFDYFHGEEDDSFNVKEMFRGTQLNKMYKRIANVIHPDKETEPLKKEEKHLLMQELAVAKKDNDVMTLVRMYSKYVPDADLLLDDATLLRMGHLLAMRIRELNAEHRDLFSRQGFKSMVWKRFSATSKKKTDAKLQEHISNAENSIMLLNKRIDKINCIKQLNKYLKSLPLRPSYY